MPNCLDYEPGKKFDAIVCLSAIDWNFLWQRTQEVMSQFATMGYPVLFVENTGVRVPGIKDIPRVWQRLNKLFRANNNKNIGQKHKNVEILSPIALPLPYSPTAVKLNASLLRNRVLRFSKEKNIPVQRILLWSYMTTPLAVKLAQILPWAGVVVDLVSDPCKVQGAKAIEASHKNMLALADTVLCASTTTMDTARQYMDEGRQVKLQLFEDGFSPELYELAQNETYQISIPGANPTAPMVAYIGGVNSKIWWEAVSAMAQQLPEVNFVFVGPKDYDTLPCVGYGKNVFWLPQFEGYGQLGAFLKQCQAGLIPYKPTPYVLEMRPAKINEYMVMGLPIVATRMPELVRLEQQLGPGIAYLAENAEALADAVRRALDEDCEESRKKRREITQIRSWEKVCCGLEKNLNGMKWEE